MTISKKIQGYVYINIFKTRGFIQFITVSGPVCGRVNEDT